MRIFQELDLTREAAYPAPLTPHYTNKKSKYGESNQWEFNLMDYIEKVLEKLKEWTRKLVEALLGPEAQPEPIPIPVNDRPRRS